MVENLSAVDRWTKQLGLMWKVNSAYAEVDRPQIISDPNMREHRIGIPMNYKSADYEFDLVHELIHAEFAEKKDPIFSTIYFDRRYDTENVQTRRQMYEVYYAQQFIDIWVGDRMLQLDPKLVEGDISTWNQSVNILSNDVLEQNAKEFELGYAIGSSLIQRHGLTQFQNENQNVLVKMRKALGKPSEARAKGLARLYSTLPLMPQTIEESLSVFQDFTRRSAEIWRFGIQPTLIQDENRWVWKINDDDFGENK